MLFRRSTLARLCLQIAIGGRRRAGFKDYSRPGVRQKDSIHPLDLQELGNFGRGSMPLIFRYFEPQTFKKIS